MGTSNTSLRQRAALVAGALVGVETIVVARRRGALLALDTIVRCRHGHLFTTWWLPGASFKALRLGWWRFQRCPVGRHFDLVTPVRVSTLTDEERRNAACHHDVRVP
jgi:hypothetical protein